MATQRMLIDATHPEETRVVVIAGHRLDDFDVEVASRKQLKGNIYLAKVTRVEPSLQAAFVDYGGNRHGFLAFNEIHPDYYQIPVEDRQALIAEHDAAEKADEAAVQQAENGEAKPPGAVETVGGDDDEEIVGRRPNAPRRHYKIQEVIKRRQILLVQVVKEERGTKGAALTTYLSLAGRYCVLMPNTARGGGISRKIAGGSDRKRLKSVLNELEIPEGMAVIVRTAGASRSKAEIRRDYDYLIRLWADVRALTLESIAPALVYEEGSIIKRAIRDLYTNDIEEVLVAGDEAYRHAKDFMKMLIPSHAKRVKLYKDEAVSLLRRYQVEDQLAAIHSPQVQLKSGGYIVINSTEALVAIDVNSGRATRERNIEETALRTNLEAADEIARQLRLRDLAGLIVIDFIDMENSRNQAQVERRLKEAMRNDRARIQIGRISPFGLLELSRQRLQPSLIETSSVPCPHCGGTGIRRSTDSSALAVLRALEEEGARQRAEEVTVHVASAVALYILNQKRAALDDLEKRFGMRILIMSDDSLIPPDHRIERTRARTGQPPQLPARPTPIAMPSPTAEEEEAEEAEAEEAEAEIPETEGEREVADATEARLQAGGGPSDVDGSRRRRRRRRRRRGGGTSEDHAGPPRAPGEAPEHSAATTGAGAAEYQPSAEEGTAEGNEDLEAQADVGPRQPGIQGRSEGDEQQDGQRRRRRGRRGGRNRRRREGERVEHEQTEFAGGPGDMAGETPASIGRLLGGPDMTSFLSPPDTGGSETIALPKPSEASYATAPAPTWGKTDDEPRPRVPAAAEEARTPVTWGGPADAALPESSWSAPSEPQPPRAPETEKPVDGPTAVPEMASAPQQIDPEEAARRQRASKTEVVEVGKGEQLETGTVKRGWWRRPAE